MSRMKDYLIDQLDSGALVEVSDGEDNVEYIPREDLQVAADYFEGLLKGGQGRTPDEVWGYGKAILYATGGAVIIGGLIRLAGWIF